MASRSESHKSRKKAKHEANQEALDRLYEKCEQAGAIQGSKFVHTIRKAAKSLQACATAVTTTKEAKALHGVGDSLARIIVPKTKDASIVPLSRASSSTSTTIVTANTSAESISTATDTTTTTTSNRLKRKAPPNANLNTDRKLSGKHSAYLTAVKDAECLQLPADDWRVILIVDGREHGWEKVLAKLQMSGIPSEKRNLPIGDMAWIARSGSIEIMLGTIIERKEVHDLASSLFGTRYLEQRLRLQHCGLPQVFLLVEGDTKSVTNCPHESLQMAMMETRVQLDFQVVQTKHLEDTVRFLKSVHRRILQRSFPSAFYGGDTTASSLPTFSSPSANRRKRRKSIMKPYHRDRRSFEEMVFDKPPLTPFGTSRFITYKELKCKVEKDREEGTKTIGAIFCGMLKQIPKVSNSTIPPLAQAFPTPHALLQALDGLNETDGKSLLADLVTGNQRVGEQKAREIYYTFMTGGDESLVATSFTVDAVQEITDSVAAQRPESQETSSGRASKKDTRAGNGRIENARTNLPVIQKPARTTSQRDHGAIMLLESPSPSTDTPKSKLRTGCGEPHMEPSPPMQGKSRTSYEIADEYDNPRFPPKSEPALSRSDDKRELGNGTELLTHLTLSENRSLVPIGNVNNEIIRCVEKEPSKAPNRCRESIDSLDLEIAKLAEKSRHRSAPVDLSQSSDDNHAERWGFAIDAGASFCKRLTISQEGALTSDSDGDESLRERISRRKPHIQSINQPNHLMPSASVLREVSTSDNGYGLLNPEIIDLSH